MGVYIFLNSVCFKQWHPSSNETPSTQILVYNTILQYKEKWLTLGRRQRIHKVSLYATVPESKEMPEKQNDEHVRGTQESTEVFNDQSWNN